MRNCSIGATLHTGATMTRKSASNELDAECDPDLGQTDPIICQVCRKLTKFRVTLLPGTEYDPNGPFSGLR